MRISDWSSDVCSSDLARQQVPEEVAAAYGGARSFGPDYIIPAPFDPRLIEEVPLAVARAAIDRKGVVSGKSVSVRVDLGGRRVIKKKKECKAKKTNQE